MSEPQQPSTDEAIPDEIRVVVADSDAAQPHDTSLLAEVNALQTDKAQRIVADDAKSQVNSKYPDTPPPPAVLEEVRTQRSVDMVNHKHNVKVCFLWGGFALGSFVILALFACGAGYLWALAFNPTWLASNPGFAAFVTHAYSLGVGAALFGIYKTAFKDIFSADGDAK